MCLESRLCRYTICLLSIVCEFEPVASSSICDVIIVHALLKAPLSLLKNLDHTSNCTESRVRRR